MLIELIGLVLLCVLGFFAFQYWKKNNAGDAESSTPSLENATVEDVRSGGVIQLPPHGEAMDALDVEVTAVHIYDEDGFTWSELEGTSGQGTVWLDVERDDELETSVTLKRLQLDDVGLTPEILSGLRSGTSKTVELEGSRFRFTERGKATFYARSDRSHPESLEFWDFEGEDDRHDLGVERWQEDYRVYLSQRLDPARIRLYSLGSQ